MRIRHIGIVTDNLERSLAFYYMLGFVVVKHANETGEFIDTISELRDTDVVTVKMLNPHEQMIELLFYNSHPYKNRSNPIYQSMHLAFTVTDIDLVYEKLKECGIYFTCKPQTSPDGNARVTFCRSPEKTLIEIVEEI